MGRFTDPLQFDSQRDSGDDVGERKSGVQLSSMQASRRRWESRIKKVDQVCRSIVHELVRWMFKRLRNGEEEEEVARRIF